MSGDRFGAPSHIPYAFIVRVENKIHIVYLLTVIEVYACYVVKIYKKNQREKGRPALFRALKLLN